MRLIRNLSLTAGALALSGLGCSQEPGSGAEGAHVSVSVAPLDGSGIGVACFDLQVYTASGLLWKKGDSTTSYLDYDEDTVCSDQFGTAGGGSIRWVGSCDAQASADTDLITPGVQNTVTLWFDGIYDQAKTATTQVYDPCGAGGCSIDFTCVANGDSPAEFNFSVIRDAEQGFFDIAVRFDSIYCSSKYDDCYGNERISLFSGEDGAHNTGVFALACTAPSPDDVDLYYGDVVVACSGVNFPIDPTVTGTATATSVPPGHALTYTVFRAPSTTSCNDETCNGLYWNIAFDLKDLSAPELGSCSLAFSATGTKGNGTFVNGAPSAGSTYPYVDVSATLNGPTCQQNPLNGDESAVVTAYHGAFGLPSVPMCYRYDGTLATPTGNTACGTLPQPAPAGRVLKGYSASCNPPDGVFPDVDRVTNPIQCGVGEICGPGNPYNQGRCIPATTRFCNVYVPGDDCSSDVLEVTFSITETTDVELPIGTIVRSATDADADSDTGYQYQAVITERVVLSPDVASVTVRAIPYQAQPDEHIPAGVLTVIGAEGNDPQHPYVIVTNTQGAGANGDSYCANHEGMSDGVGYCILKASAQPCDDESPTSTCPTGSYCDNQGNGAVCRQYASVGTRCSQGSSRPHGCAPGLHCAANPMATDPNERWAGHCIVPGGEGTPCEDNYAGDRSECAADYYCRYESNDFSTCSKRKALGEICGQGGGMTTLQHYTGNCLSGLLCKADPSSNNYRCAANPPLEHGSPCWISDEAGLAKCKGHCDIDVPNPFENINADGVCKPDVDEGAFCHADRRGGPDYGGYCKRGLYCDEEGFGQNASGLGICLPVSGIGSFCAQWFNDPDSACADEQICGSPDLSFLNGREAYCVDRGCGNRIVEGEELIDQAWEFEVLDGQLSNIYDAHPFVVGQELKVYREYYNGPQPGWQIETVTATTEFTIALSGGVGQYLEEVEVIPAAFEMCDEGPFNCDTFVNGQYLCPCSTICMPH